MTGNGHQIHIEGCGGFFCHENESVLAGMHRLGKRGIPLGCRGGGCGVCKVQVLEGEYVKAIMSRAHVSQEDENAGRVLACRIFPRTDLSLKVIGQLQKNIFRSA